MLNKPTLVALSTLLAAGIPSYADSSSDAFDINSPTQQGKHPVPFEDSQSRRYEYGTVVAPLSTRFGNGAFTYPTSNRLSLSISGEGSSGVGMAITRDRAGHFVVIDIAPKSSAEANHIAVGDRILSANGSPIDGLTMVEVVKILRGAPETTVELEIESGSARKRYLLVRKPLPPSEFFWLPHL